MWWLKSLNSLSYKSASNNNFIEGKRVKPKYTGSLQEPPKKDYFVQKGHKNVIKVQRKHKTMYKLKGNL